MPPYPGSSLATLLYENSSGWLWQNETVAVGASSRGFELRRERGASYPFGFSVEVQFFAAPGTFTVALQTADTDVDGNYVTLGSLTTGGLNANNVGRIEVNNAWCKYVRLNMVALGNAVSVSAKLTR